MLLKVPEQVLAFLSQPAYTLYASPLAISYGMGRASTIWPPLAVFTSMLSPLLAPLVQVSRPPMLAGMSLAEKVCRSDEFAVAVPVTV